MKKLKNNTPRRKRMSRHGRLQNAQKFAKDYNGKNIVKGYAKWFGVDLQCALTELQLAGIKINPQTKKNNKQAIQNKQRQIQLKIEKSKLQDDHIHSEDYDEHFSFIAGYTSGGAPYGITWEEAEEKDLASAPQPKNF